MNDSEGLGTLHRFFGFLFLKYMEIRSKQSYISINEATRHAATCFEKRLEESLEGRYYASLDEMLRLRVMKRKYCFYAAYLAALSSFPILHKVASKNEILSTILAKVSLITSIKALDNINDTWHSPNAARHSLERQFKTIGTGEVFLLPEDNLIYRAENSCMIISAWVNRWLATYASRATLSREIFIRDLKRYLEGQALSFSQKERAGGRSPASLDIKRYLISVNEKAVGSIWVDLDFCLLESILGELSSEQARSLHLIRKGVDHVFKACNIYDDIADLNQDLSEGIWNSVVYLGIDQGRMDHHGKLRVDRNLVRESVRLGDLIYLRGLACIRKAGSDMDAIDACGLLAGLTILRIFSIRKRFIMTKDIFSVLDFLYPRSTETIAKYLPYIEPVSRSEGPLYEVYTPSLP